MDKKKIKLITTPTIWIAGLSYTLYSHLNGCPHDIILGGWLITPPLWLWLEYQFLFNSNTDDWKLFQHKQLLQRNLWFGVVIFLALKYLPLD